MISLKRFALAAVIAVGTAPSVALGQPALTTIQDILYRADGTRFNGTMSIAWNSFQSGGGANIATSNLTLPIVNGVLKVQLVPTTDASAGAQYNITYNSNGGNQFTEVWAVPPSTLPVTVRSLRISSGTVVGPQPVVSSILISDVTGLQNELNLRPLEGVGFAPARTAVIDSAGMIDAAVGNLSDCVRVDGTSGPCGSGGGLVPSHSDSEAPSGVVNGVNTTFTLRYAPSPAASLELFNNGVLLAAGVDYQLVGNTIALFVGSTPQPGDALLAGYRYANPSNPLGSLTAAQVVCSSTGSQTSVTSLTSLGRLHAARRIAGSRRPAGNRFSVRAHRLGQWIHGKDSGWRHNSPFAKRRGERNCFGRPRDVWSLFRRAAMGRAKLGRLARFPDCSGLGG